MQAQVSRNENRAAIYAIASGRRCKWSAVGLLVAALVGLGLFAQASMAANVVVAGDDAFYTPTGAELDTVIPAGFFDPGSDAYSLPIPLVGSPLDPGTLDQTDTIVRRLANANLVAVPSNATVSTRLIALCMLSINSIEVFYGGINGEFWDVRVQLQNVPQPTGTMDLQRTTDVCGTAQTSLNGKFEVRFTRVSDSAVRTLLLDETLTTAGPIPWSEQSQGATSISAGQTVPTNCDGSLTTLSTGTSNFQLGVETLQCIVGGNPPDPLACQVRTLDKELFNNGTHSTSVAGWDDASCCYTSGPLVATCEEVNVITPKGCFDAQEAGLASFIVGADANCSTPGSCCIGTTCIADSNKCCCELNGGTFVDNNNSCTPNPCDTGGTGGTGGGGGGFGGFGGTGGTGGDVPSLSTLGIVVLCALLGLANFAGLAMKKRDP
jgi:hypothetical protein